MTEPDELGWALATLARWYHGRIGSLLAAIPHGPRGYQTLAAAVRGEQPNQALLANCLRIHRTVMTYLIDDLVAAELVERQTNSSDRGQQGSCPPAGHLYV